MAETLFFNALRAAIDEEMARDENVFVLGEDVGHYGGSYKVTKDLYKKYGDLRVLDTPIAENSFTGLAVGAAMTGWRRAVEVQAAAYGPRVAASAAEVVGRSAYLLLGASRAGRATAPGWERRRDVYAQADGRGRVHIPDPARRRG